MIKDPIILAIDTSCDETTAAVVWGRRILSNVISSQVDIHQKYGGVYPALAKRAHQERIDGVVNEALKRASVSYNKINSSLNAKIKMQNAKSLASLKLRRSGQLKIQNYENIYIDSGVRRNDNDSGQARMTMEQNQSPNQLINQLTCLPAGKANQLILDAVAVTQGPGLAIALEVGIQKAKDLAFCINQNAKCKMQNQIQNSSIQGQSVNSLITDHQSLITGNQLPLIAVNHLEGHILSTIAQNSMANPKRDIQLPALALVVSGGNTQMLFVHEVGKYELIGETLDDACGEALDKAARILHLGYPGGPIIERLALTGDPNKYVLKPTLTAKNNLNFSYSGLKTAFLYLVQKLPDKEFGANLNNLAAAFQYWAFEQIARKLTQAITIYQPKSVLCGGGVLANSYLRHLLHRSTSKFNVPIYFPTTKLLYGDNAAMIGVAAYYKYLRGEFVKPEGLDRKPRFPLC